MIGMPDRVLGYSGDTIFIGSAISTVQAWLQIFVNGTVGGGLVSGGYVENNLGYYLTPSAGLPEIGAGSNYEVKVQHIGGDTPTVGGASPQPLNTWYPTITNCTYLLSASGLPSADKQAELRISWRTVGGGAAEMTQDVSLRANVL